MIAVKMRDQDFFHMHEIQAGKEQLALCALSAVEEYYLAVHLQSYGGEIPFFGGPTPA